MIMGSKKTFRFSSQPPVLLICGSFLLAILFGLYQELMYPDLDLLYAYDFWSLTHFFCVLALTLLVSYKLPPRQSFLLIQLLFAGWEILENYFETQGYVLRIGTTTYTLFQEIPANQIADLLFNFMGGIAALFYLDCRLDAYSPDSSALFDRNSAGHLIYGFFLGVIAIHWGFIFIAAIILIPIEVMFHQVWKKSFTLKTPNAQMDLFIAYCGFLFAFIILL